MNLEQYESSERENLKIFLRKMRNDIIGSLENKTEYIKNSHLSK